MAQLAVYVPTTKGHPQLYLQSRLFQRKVTNQDGSVVWRCRENRNQDVSCKSKCKTFDHKVVQMPSPHVNECLPVPLSAAEGLYFANEVKTKATNSTEPMKQMFEKTVMLLLRSLTHLSKK